MKSSGCSLAAASESMDNGHRVLESTHPPSHLAQPATTLTSSAAGDDGGGNGDGPSEVGPPMLPSKKVMEKKLVRAADEAAAMEAAATELTEDDNGEGWLVNLSHRISRQLDPSSHRLFAASSQARAGGTDGVGTTQSLTIDEEGPTQELSSMSGMLGRSSVAAGLFAMNPEESVDDADRLDA